MLGGPFRGRYFKRTCKPLIIVLLCLLLFCVLVSFVVLTQIKGGLELRQRQGASELKEAILRALGEQKADFRDFNQQSVEQLRKSLGDSFTNQSLVLEKRFESLQQQTDKRLDEIRGNVEKRLQTSFEQNFGAFKEMNKSLLHLKGSADQMLKVSEQVSELNHILASPKLQGNFGETALQDLLNDILPSGAFEWQPRLAEGCQPDACIRIKEHRLCIDAKFPKDRIAALLDAARDDAALHQANKELAAVIRSMASDIAKKYIRPELGTTDQVFLFVPSEKLYYEVLKMPDLVEHCRKLKVSIVSPNTMGATLYAVALAFRGYEMQENARALVKSIQEMDKHFRNFQSDFENVGKRIEQAQNDYVKAGRDLERFDKTITKLRDGEARIGLDDKSS
jgi:DNA recombination protein RmuC